MISPIRKRNTTTVILIKNFVNKKSGKVSEARKEIQNRFCCLDWKDQKKIILAFLESNKKDRQWAYSQALYYWDKSFEPKIRELWEHLHEERCSWIIIRYFPVEYLTDNIELFIFNNNYYYICRRLAENKNFVIDKDRLYPTEYLSVMSHAKRFVPDEEAMDILYFMVHKACIETSETSLEKYFNVEDVITPINFQKVNLCLYYLRKLNCPHIISQFMVWNDIVRKAIYKAPEFEAIYQSGKSFWENRKERIAIARKYAYITLDDKYKLSSDPAVGCLLESKEHDDDYEAVNSPEKTFKSNPQDITMLREIIAENPAVEKLVQSLSLEEDNDIYPF